MGAHSDIGPSSADRWMNCPGSVRLRSAGRNPTGEAAAQGIVAHDLAYKLVSGKLEDEDLLAMMGKTVICEGHAEVEIDEDMVDGIMLYRDTIVGGRRDARAVEETAPIQKHFEVKVEFGGGVWGTADAIVFRKGHKLFVYDFGAWPRRRRSRRESANGDLRRRRHAHDRGRSSRRNRASLSSSARWGISTGRCDGGRRRRIGSRISRARSRRRLSRRRSRMPKSSPTRAGVNGAAPRKTGVPSSARPSSARRACRLRSCRRPRTKSRSAQYSGKLPEVRLMTPARATRARLRLA